FTFSSIFFVEIVFISGSDSSIIDQRDRSVSPLMHSQGSVLWLYPQFPERVTSTSQGASMSRHLSCPRLAIAVALALAGLALSVSAQDRLSDKDIDALMSNLKNDTKSFRPQFNSAVRNTIIRKTSREKDAKILILNFENQTKGMSENFKRTRKADELPTVLNTSGEIEKLINELKLYS